MSVVTVVRAVVGAVGLLRPRVAARLWGADPWSPEIALTARVLGARHLLQAVVLALRPTSLVRRAGILVDLLHALSMVVLAMASRRLRRPALTSAGVAFALSAASRWSGRRGGDKLDHPRELDHPGIGDRANPRRGLDQLDAVDTPAEVDRHDALDPPPRLDRPPELGHQGALDPARMTRAAHQRAAWMTRRSKVLEERTMRQPRPPWSRPATWVVLTTGVWLLVGQWLLPFPFTVTGQNTGLRDTGFAVLVSLAGLRLAVARRSNTATVVVLLSGALLVCASLLAAHDGRRAQLDELGCGVLLLVAGLATLDRPRARRPQQDHPGDGTWQVRRQAELSGR